jgi:hypothetical protein
LLSPLQTIELRLPVACCSQCASSATFRDTSATRRPLSRTPVIVSRIRSLWTAANSCGVRQRQSSFMRSRYCAEHLMNSAGRDKAGCSPPDRRLSAPMWFLLKLPPSVGLYVSSCRAASRLQLHAVGIGELFRVLTRQPSGVWSIDRPRLFFSLIINSASRRAFLPSSISFIHRKATTRLDSSPNIISERVILVCLFVTDTKFVSADLVLILRAGYERPLLTNVSGNEIMRTRPRQNRSLDNKISFEYPSAADSRLPAACGVMPSLGTERNRRTNNRSDCSLTER